MSAAAALNLAALQNRFAGLPKDLLSTVLQACSGNVEKASVIVAQLLSEAADAEESKPRSGGPNVPRMPDGSARSMTQLYGVQSSECGYCHSGLKSATSWGMVCEQLTPIDYQSLIDLGWRRSGDYLYKVHMQEQQRLGWKTLVWLNGRLMLQLFVFSALSCVQQDNLVSCCTHYTIRLDVQKYTRNKAQRAAINRFERFLRGEQVGAADSESTEDGTKVEPMKDTPAASSSPVDPHADRIQHALLAAVQALVAVGTLPATLVPDLYSKLLRVYAYVEPAKKGKGVAVEVPATAASAAAAPSSSRPQYSSNAALVLSGVLRKLKLDFPAARVAQLLAKQLITSATASALPPIQPSVVEPIGHLNFFIEGAEYVHSHSRANSQERVAMKKAPFVKKSDAGAPAVAASAASAAAPALNAHTFEIKQVPAEFDERAFQLYKRYQMSVHKDPESKLKPSQYKNFLCSSPLVKEGPYGGFHQHYILDNKLIAVGVVDILPSCLSSVYLFYDPDLEHLNLGTVTAVKEIEWVQKMLTPKYPALKYYVRWHAIAGGQNDHV
jgi:arginine-tRNA-protein transferase